MIIIHWFLHSGSLALSQCEHTIRESQSRKIFGSQMVKKTHALFADLVIDPISIAAIPIWAGGET